ncbi:glutamate receptor ionotropic, kainate 2 isoform X1 [Drosophila busckii]|uniref:glutamate receptor ionotropic, kainate 2 isoform X1 n=1 Tax=Drosophila busckii TaxID=30019 RepID=UPI00083ECC92|nr:glutamate receptor ionotropic, kainate 2 isoform X1 [Drosophila busckii]
MQFWLITLILLWPNLCQVQSYGGSRYGGNREQSIRIGLITDDESDHIRQTFEHAIAVVNNDLSVPLQGEVEHVNYGNSLLAFGQLCRLMQSGVGAVFGPSARHTAAHLLTACDAKDIPFVYPHLSWNAQTDGFNLHPHPQDIAHALYDIITQFDWSRFIFCYESSEYLTILDELISLYGIKGPVIKVMRYDLNLNGNYKSVLRRIRKSEDSRIVVVGSTEGVAELLRQAQQVGIMNEDYTYLVGNLDLHTYELEEYKYSEANITGLRMFDPAKKEVRDLLETLHQQMGEDTTQAENPGATTITLAMALTYDAVRVIAEASKLVPYQPAQLNCSERHDNVQPDGSTFRNYMRSLEILNKTITGRIFFQGNVRKGFSFDVIELQPDGLVKVGTWEEGKDFEFKRPPQVAHFQDNEENSLVNKTFNVLISVPNKPYASLVESINTLIGNSQYEGYGIDLIKELAEKLGFNFTFINGGNDYGSFNKSTNITTGMLKEIVEGRADLAIADLTITSEREEVIDFSLPFMNLGIAILYITPQKAEPALFSFMDPFSKEVWLYLGLAYLGVTLCLFVLGRLSPSEWDNPYPCIEEPEELENQFSINNSLWFTTGALLQQGSEIAPKALSTRTISSIWWFFTLIMVSSYTANLAAFLTIVNPTSSIDNVEDLANNKDEVQYGAKRTGSTRNFFLTSEDPIYMKMNEYMTTHPEMLTETNQDGVKKVKASTKYAFLMESTSIEFNTVRECNLTKIGDALDEKGYGIAMVKNWPYRDKFNNALLELQEQGVLARLKKKWWNEIGAGVCSASSDDSGPSELGMDNLSGIYAVLIVGSILTFIFSILYWCIFVFKKAKFYDVHFTDALVEEFKIVISFSENERILKSAQSVYSRSRNSSSQSIESIETDSEDHTPQH